MGKVLLLILVIASAQLWAYSDFDMDGVEDANDQCPNTLMNELVDIGGCTIKSLKSSHNFDIIAGLAFSQTSYDGLEKADTMTKTLQVDYYYENFSLQASSSYYDSQSASYDDSGFTDSFLGAYYKLSPQNRLDIRVGAGLIIPTYDSSLGNNNTDYVASVNVSYMLDVMNIFGGYSFTLVNDNDYGTGQDKIRYQNTHSYNAGAGFYPTNKLYLSASYNSSDSIYQDVERIETASLYGFYNIDANWFSTLNYAYGLSSSASDNYVSLRLGYYF